MGALFYLFYNTLNYKNNSLFSSEASLLKSFNKSKNRGSDYTDFITDIGTDISNKTLSKEQKNTYKLYKHFFGYHRIFINDMTHNGNQPFEYPIKHKIQLNTRRFPQNTVIQREIKLLGNGEIYNYTDLKKDINEITELQSISDIEIILPIYLKNNSDIVKTINELDGDFSFILVDNYKDINLENIKIYAVRDVFGLKPMYICYNQKGDNDVYLFVSELKSIPEYMLTNDFIIKPCPIGSYFDFSEKIFKTYYDWNKFKTLSNCCNDKTDPESIDLLYNKLYQVLTNSIKSKFKNLPKNKDIGILFSGGFDSSLLLSLILEYNLCDTNLLKIITIGNLNDDSDAINAQNTLKYLENKYKLTLEHHIINISAENLKNQTDLIEIINIIETYDLDTIRDTYPYYYLFKYIKEYLSNICVIFTGDGLDEICCGYSEIEEYDDTQFQIKNVEMIKNISKYDILRAEKMSSYFGLECRHPYINTEFVEFYLSIHPKLKRQQVYKIESGIPNNIEKYLIRKCIELQQLLPTEIIFRKLKWSSQCINNFELLLEEIYGNTEQQIYKEIFIKIFKKDTISELWVDYWK